MSETYDESESDIVTFCDSHDPIELHKPFCLSLPSNDDFKSLLVSLSIRLANRYLITRVIHCRSKSHLPGSETTGIYNVTKPLVWHRYEGSGFVVGRAVR